MATRGPALLPPRPPPRAVVRARRPAPRGPGSADRVRSIRSSIRPSTIPDNTPDDRQSYQDLRPGIRSEPERALRRQPPADSRPGDLLECDATRPDPP